jgi:hypothetical protein
LNLRPIVLVAAEPFAISSAERIGLRALVSKHFTLTAQQSARIAPDAMSDGNVREFRQKRALKRPSAVL